MIYYLFLNIFNQPIRTQRVSQQNVIEIYIKKKLQTVGLITSQNLWPPTSHFPCAAPFRAKYVHDLMDYSPPDSPLLQEYWSG